LRRREFVQKILQNHSIAQQSGEGEAFAPINIALIKYWGKRDNALNLPLTDSLSLAFPEWGTRTRLAWSPKWSLSLNGQPQQWGETSFGRRLWEFLGLFDLPTPLVIETTNNIPTAAGLASSASGYAALVLALDQLCGWGLPRVDLSLLARLGSGSACRSLWPGFVHWQKGEQANGSDSHGHPLSLTWPTLKTGILLLDVQKKAIGSREAMEHTQKTSRYYPLWPGMLTQDLGVLRQALASKDFTSMGQVMEDQAVMLHALMATSHPPVVYTSSATAKAISDIHTLRHQGHQIYYTQDAGPSLCVFFNHRDEQAVQQMFPDMLISTPFPPSQN
jgi:diphosphomevalonate decarboxylase